jgi:hypothetical protein
VGSNKTPSIKFAVIYGFTVSRLGREAIQHRSNILQYLVTRKETDLN